ncbi:hypothetical protein [Sinosporangium siamense]|uniref:Uncharacterized protein n=1 Tax=Sinosporangium siamense TaxID=1367973 RepID=A0A919RR28_9ACTN|nr:hypothetical protein [Sinosporangium siamense]GII96669.1 hypothetical protein Ssi02_69000 [Sinosporangium siamense]
MPHLATTARPSPRAPAPATRAAVHLAEHCLRLGLAGVVHERGGLAVLALECGVNVWVDDMGGYRWWTGRSDTAGRHVWAFCPWASPGTAARRIAVDRESTGAFPA